MVAGTRESLTPISLPTQATLPTPAAGNVVVGAKSDGKVYRKESSGVETELGGGAEGGGGTAPYATTIGDGVATSIVVTHSLGTRDVGVIPYFATTPWEDLNVRIERTTIDTVTLIFTVPPALDSIRVVVFNQATDAGVAAATAISDSLAVTGKGFISHGATAGTARPTGYASVEWHGSVQPTNMAVDDTWVDTS